MGRKSNAQRTAEAAIAASKDSAGSPATDIAVIKKENGLAQVAPSVFKDVDFGGLNEAIDALGSASEELDKDQRDSAVGIISDWRNNVVQRLHDHSDDMKKMLEFFKGVKYYHGYAEYFTDAQLEALAERTETLGLYHEYLNLEEEKKVLMAEQPEAPVYSDDMTGLEWTKLNSDYQYNSKTYSNKLNKLGRKVDLAYNDWIMALNKNEEVKEMISKAQVYTRGLSKLINDCDSKTSLAKLNVKIGSKAIRDSLKSLLDFTTSL